MRKDLLVGIATAVGGAAAGALITHSVSTSAAPRMVYATATREIIHETVARGGKLVLPTNKPSLFSAGDRVVERCESSQVMIVTPSLDGKDTITTCVDGRTADEYTVLACGGGALAQVLVDGKESPPGPVVSAFGARMSMGCVPDPDRPHPTVF